MTKRTVLLRSDHPGEDEAYTICAVEIDTDSITLDDFEKRATAMMDEIRERPEYEESELIVALERAGFSVVPAPTEIIVRS